MELQQKTPVNAIGDSPVIEDKSLPFTYSYRDLLEQLPVAIYACDQWGRISFYNQSAAKLWGRDPEIGKDLWCGSWKIYRTDGSLLLPDEYPMAITLKEGRAVNGEEMVIERPDGVWVNILSHSRPIFDSNGKISGAVNLLIDISVKKAKESTINEGEEKYRILSESLERIVEERTATLKSSEERIHKMIEEVEDYAILLLSKEGTVLNWNRGAERIKGYLEKEIVGRNFRIFYREQDRETGIPEQLIKEATEKGKAMHEGWRLRKDGTQFWGSIVITALHDEQHEIIGFSKVTRDLTEKKIAEDKLKEYANELELRNTQLEEYAYVASHDLQEPLRKIQTFAYLLEKDIDDKAAVNKNLEKIKISASRMSALIKDVLKYSQVSPTAELFVETDLNRILENVKEDFDLLIEQKKVIITNDVLPVIQGIPVQMHQLFSNLIGNAIKFTNQRPVIEITCEKILNEDVKKYPQLNGSRNYVKLVFKDNGIGFKPEYADQVFKLFQRLNDTEYGTGIGLALCKKIVENHKGYISVSSEPDKGTLFTVFLPIS